MTLDEVKQALQNIKGAQFFRFTYEADVSEHLQDKFRTAKRAVALYKVETCSARTNIKYDHMKLAQEYKDKGVARPAGSKSSWGEKVDGYYNLRRAVDGGVKLVVYKNNSALNNIRYEIREISTGNVLKVLTLEELQKLDSACHCIKQWFPPNKHLKPTVPRTVRIENIRELGKKG